jgi:hypothetical protein
MFIKEMTNEWMKKCMNETWIYESREHLIGKIIDT